MTKIKQQKGSVNAAERDSKVIAKATQRPGQTKEQTRLIAQGIQKGIEQYKKQHKVKVREQDKERKKRQGKSETELTQDVDQIDSIMEISSPSKWMMVLPWVLLIVSWGGFVALWRY